MEKNVNDKEFLLCKKIKNNQSDNFKDFIPNDFSVEYRIKHIIDSNLSIFKNIKIESLNKVEKPILKYI